MNAIAPLAVLHYADRDTPSRGPLLWYAMVCGVVAVGLSAAYILNFPVMDGIFGYSFDRYLFQLAEQRAALVQAGLVGAALALSFAAHLTGDQHRSPARYKTALSLALLGLVLLVFHQLVFEPVGALVR